jgi:hypothetical protein
MTREVNYTVCVPQERTRNYTVTRYECQPEEKTQTYTVRVPHTVTEEVPVTVCKMVCQEVEVPAGDCGNGGHGHGRLFGGRGGCGCN